MKSLFLCLVSVIAMTITSAPVDGQQSTSPATLRRIAVDYYDWRNRNYPVASSDGGLHAWDSKLTDYSPAAIAARRQHVRSLLAQISAMPTANWNKDDRIDWLLFRSQLE